MTGVDPTPVVNVLLDSLPDGVVAAAELVAIPHWVDDDLARDLVLEFGETNGATEAAVGHVKSLPFVSRRGRGWRIAPTIRAVLVTRVEAKGSVAKEANAFIADRIDARTPASRPADAPDMRERRWRSIYHRVPTEPRSAMEALATFVDEASARGSKSDLRAAVDLTSERHHWLSGCEAEIAYVVGRQAYEAREYDRAVPAFEQVWEGDTDRHRRLIAGHLLGVMWRKRNAEPYRTGAKEILKAAAEIAAEDGDRTGESMVRTSLGIVLKQMDTPESRSCAEIELRRALELDDQGPDWRTLNALGALLAERGRDEATMSEARDLLRRAIEVAPPSARDAINGPLVGVLSRLGGAENLSEAERLTRARGSDDQTDEAVRLMNRVTVLLARKDSASTAEALVAAGESLRIGEETGNDRHVAISLVALSFIAERQGDIGDAIAYMNRSIEINTKLGFAEHVEKSAARKAELEARMQRRRR